MRKFMINVNGKSYEVEVEEVGGTSAPVVAPVTSPSSIPTPTAKPQVQISADATKMEAPMPGNIISVAVQSGQAVEKGDVICVLEAMKMENEILAPVAGTVTVAVSSGDTVDTGDMLAAIQ